MRTANDRTGEMLCERNFDITELNHLIYAAAAVITEETNGINEYKLQTLRQHTTPWVRLIQDSINDMRKELSKLVETWKDNRQITNKKTQLLKKYSVEKEEDLDQLIEELKQKISAKTQQLIRYKK